MLRMAARAGTLDAASEEREAAMHDLVIRNGTVIDGTGAARFAADIAIDGMIETFLTVLEEFGAYPAVIQRELDRFLPFLATTKVLIAAVRAGMGREAAHEVIKEHAVAVALAMRERGAEPDLLDRLAADPRLPLDRAALDAALADRQSFTGAATSQVDRVVAGVDELVCTYPEAAAYRPGAIL